MKQMLFTALCAVVLCPSLSAQTVHQGKLSYKINARQEVVFQTNAQQVATLLRPRSGANEGAKKPFIKNFWELGDGGYSLEPTLTHSYVRAGTRTVRLFQTPCYTLDKIAPDSQQVMTNQAGDISASKDPKGIIWFGNILMTSNLDLHNIKAVRANENFVGVASFRSSFGMNRNGKLFIFYNKKEQTKATGRILTIKDARTHGNTEGVTNVFPQSVQRLSKDFYDAKVFTINNLNRDTRNIFFTFEVLGVAGFENIKDLDIVAALVLDGASGMEQSTLTMKTASSFDPNNIKAPGLVSFRPIKTKDFKYRINFENEGNSPATSVKVIADIPDGLDANTIKNVRFVPTFKASSNRDTAMRYTVAPDGKTIEFKFSNVEISGLKEDIISDKKATRGHIEYELRAKPDIKKRPLETRASIVFDQNTPIITDKDRTNFRTGISLGAKAGINFQPNTEGVSYFIGATYSAYRPSGVYLQIEAMADLNRRTLAQDSMTQTTSKTFNQSFGLFRQDSAAFSEKYQRSNAIRLVPAHLRYDIGKFLSIGIGLNADLTFSTIQRFNTNTITKFINNDGSLDIETCRFGRQQVENVEKTTVDFGVFGDLTLGNFSHGMSLGLRVMQPLSGQVRQTDAENLSRIAPTQKNPLNFQLYLSYKIL